MSTAGLIEVDYENILVLQKTLSIPFHTFKIANNSIKEHNKQLQHKTANKGKKITKNHRKGDTRKSKIIKRKRIHVS